MGSSGREAIAPFVSEYSQEIDHIITGWQWRINGTGLKIPRSFSSGMPKRGINIWFLAL